MNEMAQKRDEAPTIEQIMMAQMLRTPRAQEMDARKTHSRVIDPSDPRAWTWMRAPGKYDILGVDTPPWYVGGITSTPKKGSKGKATKKGSKKSTKKKQKKTTKPPIDIPEIKPPKIELPPIQTKPTKGKSKPSKIEPPKIELPPIQIEPTAPPKKHEPTKEELVRRIKITGGSKEDKENIRKAIKENFSREELKIINEGLRAIRITTRMKGCAGQARFIQDLRTHEIYGDILIRKDYVNSQRTVVHELVHYLRAYDTRRKESILLSSRVAPKNLKVGKAIVRYTPFGEDIDLEEAATEAETSARTKHYSFSGFADGYWKALPRVRKWRRHTQAQDILSTGYELEDRATLTYRKAKKEHSPVIGRAVATIDANEHLREGGAGNEKAMEAVQKHFKDTHISHLKLKGRVEAIDQYYTLVGKDKVENVHVYSPDAVKSVPKPKEGQVLYEWRDGRKYRVKVSSKKK